MDTNTSSTVGQLLNYEGSACQPSHQNKILQLYLSANYGYITFVCFKNICAICVILHSDYKYMSWLDQKEEETVVVSRLPSEKLLFDNTSLWQNMIFYYNQVDFVAIKSLNTVLTQHKIENLQWC